MAKVLVKRGTRAQITAAGLASGLNQGELYLVTDEDRIAVGKSATQSFNIPKTSEISGSSGGGSGSALIDFGAGSNEAQVAVTGQTLITTDSKVTLSVSGDATSPSHTASDHRYFLQLCSLTSGAPIASTGFTIYARSVHKLTGTWTIQYTWN